MHSSGPTYLRKKVRKNSVKKKKKALSLAAIASLTMLLAACSNQPVTSHSTGFWDHYIVYNFSQFIIWLSNHTGGYGMGIIIFTIIIRVLLLPLAFYQTKSMVRMQEITPQLKAVQKKYSSRDRDSMMKMQEETQKLYKEAGVHPMAAARREAAGKRRHYGADGAYHGRVPRDRAADGAAVRRGGLPGDRALPCP